MAEEKYRARSNNQKEMSEKTKNQEKEEASAKTAKVAAKAAASYFAPGVGGALVDAASKTKAGQKIFNNAGKKLSKGPVGNLSRSLDKKGGLDAIDKATDMISPSSAGENALSKGASQNPTSKPTNPNLNNGNTENSSLGKENQNKSNSFLSNFGETNKFFKGNLASKLFKYKIVIGIGIFFFFIMMFTAIVSGKDFGNLDLTNGSTSMGGSASGASADVLGKLEEVANWYIANVPEYSKSNTYQSPFKASEVRADCSGFVVAYMSYVSGVDLPNVGTGVMVDTEGSWAMEAKSAGWEVYASREIGGAANLRPGDVLVEHLGGTNGHTEVYVSPTETFGWGSKQTHYPLSKTVVDTKYTMFGDGYHSSYRVVYRYTNAVANSSTPSDLQITKMNDSSFNHGTKAKENQKYIMLHDTEMNGDATTVVNSWKNSGNGVAAHFVVNKDGTVVQAVELDVITHHAGWGGPGNYDQKYGVGNNDGQGNGDDLVGTTKEGYADYTSYGMNSYSIGIEICHVNGEDYPEEQLAAVDKLIEYIDSYYGTKSTIIDHKMWRPSNSDTDTNFPLQNYINNRHH